MTKLKCPGKDSQYWTPDDIYDVVCPHCEDMMEFFKDEPVLTCPKCDKPVRNPKLDLGCQEWCKYADVCAGKLPEDK